MDFHKVKDYSGKRTRKPGTPVPIPGSKTSMCNHADNNGRKNCISIENESDSNDSRFSALDDDGAEHSTCNNGRMRRRTKSNEKEDDWEDTSRDENNKVPQRTFDGVNVENCSPDKREYLNNVLRKLGGDVTEKRSIIQTKNNPRLLTKDRENHRASNRRGKRHVASSLAEPSSLIPLAEAVERQKRNKPQPFNASSISEGNRRACVQSNRKITSQMEKNMSQLAKYGGGNMISRRRQAHCTREEAGETKTTKTQVALDQRSKEVFGKPYSRPQQIQNHNHVVEAGLSRDQREKYSAESIEKTKKNSATAIHDCNSPHISESKTPVKVDNNVIDVDEHMEVESTSSIQDYSDFTSGRKRKLEKNSYDDTDDSLEIQAYHNPFFD